MTAVSLSIVVPTLGRPTLERTLASLNGQLQFGDEVIIVADKRGDVDHARSLFRRFEDLGWKFSSEAAVPESANRGHEQRQAGMGLAQGTHLAFMDDDDVYVPGALALMRKTAADVPVIFKMRFIQSDEELWTTPELRFCNVGTPMFVVPNDPDRLGAWRAFGPKGGGGDFAFIAGCCERMGDPIWRDEVIALIRP